MEVGTLDFVFVLFQVVVEGIKNKSNLSSLIVNFP